MDPEQTFLRVHARLSGVLARLLTPKFRAVLEYLFLSSALMLLALLVVMHVNFVAQPGCSEEFSGRDVGDAQLVQIKITGSWNRIIEDALASQIRPVDGGKDSHVEPFSGISALLEHQVPDVAGEGWNILAAKFWLNLLGTNARRSQAAKTNLSTEKRSDSTDGVPAAEDTSRRPLDQEGNSEESYTPDVSPRPLTGPGKGPLGTALLHYFARWSSYVGVCLKRAEQSLRSFWQVWRITGWEPFTGSPKGDRRSVAWNKLDSVLDFLVTSQSYIPEKVLHHVQGFLLRSCPDDLSATKFWIPTSPIRLAVVDLSDKRRRVLDPSYLYSVEKGYLMLSEAAKFHHNVRTVNITISAQNSCFGNRWQQLLIDNFVGYDTILMNSLLHARGKGYLYNFQTKELYNLNYLQEFGGVPNGFEDYIVFKCGVLITSLFVFFTTTMSVSFTLRETQARMLKFTVQLQHHARHRLPTYRLIFVHVVESLVFVPIMIGILFFLFEFFDDQLLAFMVLTLVWLCELYTMISVRTPLSMQYFPRFFFLYFMAFHIYFFSYTYGFSYLAFSATGAFMQHLVLYFWNQFEVPALQNFLQRRALFQQQGLHISSAILQVARLTHNPLLGDGRSISLNTLGPRAGSPFDERRHADNGGQPSHDSRNSVLHRGSGREHTGSQATVYPLSIRNLNSFSLNGSNGVLSEISRDQQNGLGSLFSNPSSTRADELENLDRGVHMDGQSGDGEGVGRDRTRRPAGIRYQETGSETALSASSRTHSGPLSSLGSVLPWILGSGPGNLVSFLPILRDFRDDQQGLVSSTVTSEQVDGRVLPRGGVDSEARVHRRSIHSPT